MFIVSQKNTTALDTYLAPILSFLYAEDTTDLFVNQPGEVWVDGYNGSGCYEVPELDFDHLSGLCRLIAAYNNQEISSGSPLLSGHLPGDFRVQVVVPPACNADTVLLAIRRHRMLSLPANAYKDAYSNTNTDRGKSVDQSLAALYDCGEWDFFMQSAVAERKTILTSGATGSGKSTYLNFHTRFIPDDERLITIEDSDELKPPAPNQANLYYPRNGKGVTAQQLVEVALRMKPNRIIMGEIRGAEAYDFLEAANTGHPGSLTSLHADTPQLALQRLAFMVMRSGVGIGKQEVIDYIKTIVDVIIQMRNYEVTDIEYIR